MKKYSKNIGICFLLLCVTACGTRVGTLPRHVDYVEPSSNYQRMMAQCAGGDITPCQRRYEFVYGGGTGLDYLSSSLQVETLDSQFEAVQAACDAGDKTQCARLRIFR